MNNTANIIEAFTELASSYETTVDGELRRFWGLSYRGFVDRFVGMAAVESGDAVLDIATGTGLIPLKLEEQTAKAGRLVGLDITPAMLDYARQNLRAAGLTHRISLVGASAMAMPFPSASFDAVICGLGTHHMNLSLMLAEMRRVLRRGGKALLADVGATPFWRSLVGMVLLRFLMLQFGLTDKSARGSAELEAVSNIRTADEWRQLLWAQGFVEVDITELPARHRWYPCGMIIRAVAGSVEDA